MHNLTTQTTPPEGREIDIDSHDDHRNPLDGYKSCDQCALWAKERADQVVFAFHFTVEDVAKAEAWANEHHYRYDDIEHLLHDALIEKVIHTDKWKAA